MAAARALMPAISGVNLPNMSVLPPRLLALISRLVNALMAKNISGLGQRGYSRTYWHLGRKAATMWVS